MLHQKGNLGVLKVFSLINELKFLNFILSLLKINEACCIFKWLVSFVYVFVIYMRNIIKFGSLVICKNTPELHTSLRLENSKVNYLNLKSIV